MHAGWGDLRTLRFACFALSVLLFSSVYASAKAPVRDWHCSNPDVEVVCFDQDRACAASVDEDFTPLSVFFDEHGSLSVCAYTGCWQGAGVAELRAHELIIRAEKLPFSTDPENRERRADVWLLFDFQEQLAFVRAGIFAQPLYCQ